MGDRESCNSRALINCGWSRGRIESLKIEVYNEILGRLKELNVSEATLPYFEDELWGHFNSLPTRYALEMNVEKAKDVLMHKRLQLMARTISSTPAIEVRLLQVIYANFMVPTTNYPNDHGINIFHAGSFYFWCTFEQILSFQLTKRNHY